MTCCEIGQKRVSFSAAVTATKERWQGCAENKADAELVRIWAASVVATTDHGAFVVLRAALSDY